MLYTIVPMEVIYPEACAPPEIREENGVRMEWRKDAYGQYRPSRLLSTNLADYLRCRVE